jgi:hypothetical protein
MTADEKKRLAGIIARSRDCVECDGQGLTIRWLELLDKPPSAFTCFCHRCVMGRHVKIRLEETNPEAWSRITDLYDCPDLQEWILKVHPKNRAAILAADAVAAVGRPAF